MTQTRLHHARPLTSAGRRTPFVPSRGAAPAPVRDTLPRSTVTAFADGIAGHNDRAGQATISLAHELSARLGGTLDIIGEPQSSPSIGWRAALEQTSPELVALALSATRSLAESDFNAFCLTRNAASLATLPAVARAFPGAVVVWMGAHPCLHTPGTTRTGDLSGMALAGATGIWDTGHGGELAPSDVVLVGARELDPGEELVVANFPIRRIDIGRDMIAELIETVDGRDVFVHFSCDVLSPGIVPTDFRVPGGLTADDVLETTRALAARSRVIGMQVTELEHDPEQSDTDSARLIADMLAPLLPRRP